MPPTWPRIQLFGSGFGQYGSTRNAGLWACTGDVLTIIAPTTTSARNLESWAFILVSFRSSFRGAALMNLGLCSRRSPFEKIKVAALVGLADMLRKHRPIAAEIMRRRRCPGGAAARECLLADIEVNASLSDIDLDLVAGLHEGERAADKAFGCHVQDAGAVACAAHARIGNAQHVAHAGLE